MPDCHNFSIAQWIERCTSFGFDSRRGFGLFHFSGFGLDRFGLDSCDLGLTIGFVKTVE